MNYQICEWEDNGYHDSYFYGVIYHEADGLMHNIGLGATAYASSPIPEWSEAKRATPEIAEKCRVLLAAHIFTCIREAEYKDVLTPQDANPGEFLVLLEDHKRQIKSPVPCEKCVGHGYWENPRNAADRRPCFACDGKGLVAKGEPLKDASGKILRETIPAGTRLSVITVTACGSFFRNGYNKPDRTNRSVTGKTDAGRTLSIPLKKLRREAEPMSDAELLERAITLSHHHAYGSMFGCRAWLSVNYALQAVNAAKAQAAA